MKDTENKTIVNGVKSPIAKRELFFVIYFGRKF